MWAMPLPCRSMLSSVVGFVLAAMLRNVRGLERYEDEERDGDGDGGELGGMGRIDASSSASRPLVGDHMESRATEDRSSLVEARSSFERLVKRSIIESPFRDIVVLCWERPFTDAEGRGVDTTLLVGLIGIGELFRPLATCPFSRFDLDVPASFRWNQCNKGLLDLWLTFFGGAGALTVAV